MNVAAVKLACWLSSIGITFGLSAFVFDFYRRRDAIYLPVEEAHVSEVLSKGPSMEKNQVDRLDRDTMKRSMEQLNWTGAPPVVQAEAVVDTGNQKPPVEAIDTILALHMIAVCQQKPEESVIYASLLKQPPPDTPRDFDLNIGESLPAPYDYVSVKDIRTDGVEFAFADPERPTETVKPSGAVRESLIVMEGPDGVRTPVERHIIGFDHTERVRPEETTLWRKDYYLIGTKDRDYLRDNYARVLTNDMRYKTYIDPETGRRAGIQIEEVNEGSIAARHGAQSGDVILSINGHDVSSDQEAIQFVRSNKDKYSTWTVEILRFGQKTTMTFENPNE